MAEPRTVAGVAADYRDARARRDVKAMARFQNEEACVILLTVLGRLAAEPATFIHEVALKGGILMAGELRSPRVSADIDATTGRYRRIDAGRVVREVRDAGRQFNIRADGPPERTAGGEVIRLRFDSLTDGGTAKIEVSIREDLVFAVRDAMFDLSDLGLDVFSVPALAQAELVAEKIRTLVQRAQPRDLFDLHLYLVDSGWHLEPRALAQALESKLQTTRHKRWRPDLWKIHLDEIEPLWQSTLEEWVPPERIPAFIDVVAVVESRLRELRLG